MFKIALVGSPNVGKSAVFNAITGLYATVSNYPGTTVEVTRANHKFSGISAEIIDTPGMYSVYPITEEERVTLNIITDERPTLLIHVIDAKNFERMLPLTFALKDSLLPVIVVLNMFDEALAKGINVNTGLLSQKLGAKVIATVAITGQGIDQLKEAIEDEINNNRIPPPASIRFPPFSDRRSREETIKAREIVKKTIIRGEVKHGLSALDRALISPITGLPILAVVVYLGLYKFVGVLGAGVVVDIIEGFFERRLNPWMEAASAWAIPWESVRELFTGEYGILTLGIRYAVAIILPIVTFYFLVFAVIEDSGYLPRLGFLLDRAFKRIGLSGRAIIPMVLGFCCVSMATVVTRTLPTKRERFIATLLLALCVPCAAQTGVILGLLSAKPVVLSAWALILLAVFIITGALSSLVMPGAKPSFMIEVPPMRMPKPKNVLRKTYARVVWYFKEVVPIFILASALIWIGKITGALGLAGKTMSLPLSIMGLPENSANVFIFGFFRRDYGAAGLYDMSRAGIFTNSQLLIAAVVLTLFLPCIAQFLITIKERGIKIGIGLSVFILLFSFSVGALMNGVFRVFGINF